jgi:hypothetical protein
VTGVSRKIEAVAAVFELQHGRRDRDAAALFDGHPVGCRVSLRLARANCACDLDRAAVKQQLLGQRRFAGVRVGMIAKVRRRATSRLSSSFVSGIALISLNA